MVLGTGMDASVASPPSISTSAEAFDSAAGHDGKIVNRSMSYFYAAHDVLALVIVAIEAAIPPQRIGLIVLLSG